jgi:hypothetical protein
VLESTIYTEDTSKEYTSKAEVLETKNKEMVRRDRKNKVLEIKRRSKAEKLPEMNTHRDRERETAKGQRS